jgi:hypothetical protein
VFGNAVLAGDLDCSGSAETYAVYLENPATLDMAGHTIFANNKAVGCRKPCNVISSQPGALITGAKGEAVIASGRVLVSDVSILDNPGGSVYAWRYEQARPIGRAIGKTEVVRVTHLRNGGSIGAGKAVYMYESVTDSPIRVRDVEHPKLVKMERSSVTGILDCTTAVQANNLTMNQSSISGNACTGVRANRARISQSQIDDNAGSGIQLETSYFKTTSSLPLTASSVSGNSGNGISPSHSSISIYSSDVVANGHHGVQGSDKARIFHSLVAANGTDSGCGTDYPCADIAAPAGTVRTDAGTDCDHSLDLGSGNPLGLCRLD